MTGSRNILEIQNVTKKFGKFLALNSVSFGLQPKSHTILLGQNGAGKTTLLKCIMALTKFKGHIMIDGIDAGKKGKTIRRKIGYVPQNYSFYNNLTVQGHMKLATHLKQLNQREIQQKLQAIDLWNVREKKVGSLSSGMRQRLGIAQALLGDPPLLLLDEPTSNVDYKGQAEFRTVLQQLLAEGKTLVTTTHMPGLTEIATEVIIIDKGKIIAQGSPIDLARRMGLLHIIRVRCDLSSFPRIEEEAKILGAQEIEHGESWISFIISDQKKMNLVRKLSADPGVLDIVVEPVAIESEYLRMVGSYPND